MTQGRFLSIAEQVAEHLRREVTRGRWRGTMPGLPVLAEELGVNRKTVEVALRQLEHAGVLAGQGAGRRRRIILPAGEIVRPLRIALLEYEHLAQTEAYAIELQYLLAEAGHTAFVTEKSLTELGMKVPRIRRLVETTEADAWVVCAASREVLEWFAGQPVPAFALFGRRRGLLIAGTGPDKLPAMAAATRALLALGHRRIVMLCRRMRRLPAPGAAERVFLAELAAHAVPSSAYNLPDWEESIEGFHRCLESLFRITPPTALIIDEVPFMIAALQFLAGRGLRVPEDLSLVCTDASPNFDWCRPPIAHIRWDSRPVVRRIVRWANKVSRGKDDRRQTLTPAEFVAGGTLGPPKGG